MTNKAYEAVLQYVRHNRYNSTFDSNALRARLAQSGVDSSKMGGIISSLVRSGLIERVGTTTSNDPAHNSGRVGLYMRGSASYR